MRAIIVTALVLSLAACKDSKTTNIENPDPKKIDTTLAGVNEPVSEKLFLLGKWIVSAVDFVNDMPAEQKAEVVGKATLEFFDNGQVVSFSPGDGADTATYTFERTSGQLSVLDKKQHTTKVTVQHNADTIKLTDTKGTITLQRLPG